MEFHDLVNQSMWQMLGLLWSNTDRTKPTFYTAKNLGTVQREILEALATNQYLNLVIDGSLQATATWYMREDGACIITNAAANKGYMWPLVTSLKASIKCRGVIWHRTKKEQWMDFPKQRGAHVGTD